MIPIPEPEMPSTTYRKRTTKNSNKIDIEDNKKYVKNFTKDTKSSRRNNRRRSGRRKVETIQIDSEED